MRGIDNHRHPAKIMGKKSSPCGRTDGAVEVEDHGNGFMFVGCSDIDQARRILSEYVKNPEDYAFAGFPGGTAESGRYACRIWLSAGPAEFWDGAVSHLTGEPMPR